MHVPAGDVARDRAIVWSRTDRPARTALTTGRRPQSTSERSARAQSADDERFWLYRARRFDTASTRPADFYRVQFEDSTDSRNLEHSRPWNVSVGAARSARYHVRLVGRHRWPGVGHQYSVGRPAHVRDDAPRVPGLFHPYRQHDSRRLDGAAGNPPARWHDVENVVTDEKSKSRRNAQRVPRAITRTTCSTTTCGVSTGRSAAVADGTTMK